MTQPAQFQFRPIDASAAAAIAGWQYPPPYEWYNGNSTLEEVAWLLDPANSYFAVYQDDALIAFRCFGRDGQVEGGDYTAAALDIGGGLRPDLTGRGLGATLLEAGLSFGRQLFAPPAFRVTVAAENERALIVCRRAGFEAAQRFRRAGDGREFVVLIKSEREDP